MIRRRGFSDDHAEFRSLVDTFVQREVVPHQDDWEREGLIDRAAWLAAGRAGLLGVEVPSELGGGDSSDPRYRLILIEELAKVGANSLNASFSVQDDLVVPYLKDLAQPAAAQKWLPRMCAGESIGALAMTEPSTGSDLAAIRTRAERTDSGWRISGQKTFITNGVLADVAVVLARTSGAASGGLSLFAVDTRSPGFSRGRKLEKLGLSGNDTAELFLDNVEVAETDLVGEEGHGFAHVMERLPRERYSIGATSIASAQAAFDWTVAYTSERTAFGKPVLDFQNTRFVLADISARLTAGWAMLDGATDDLTTGTLSVVDAARLKLYLSDLQQDVVTQCLQLHGGYGYMREYPIARAFVDARIQPIYGGTNEIMKEIIGRDIAAEARSLAPAGGGK